MFCLHVLSPIVLAVRLLKENVRNPSFDGDSFCLSVMIAIISYGQSERKLSIHNDVSKVGGMSQKQSRESVKIVELTTKMLMFAVFHYSYVRKIANFLLHLLVKKLSKYSKVQYCARVLCHKFWMPVPHYTSRFLAGQSAIPRPPVILLQNGDLNRQGKK